MRFRWCLALVSLLVLPVGMHQGARCFGASQPSVAHWAFDGDLRDGSGWGRHLTMKGARFVPGHRGQALRLDREYVEAPSRPELELAPGLRIECWVKFVEQPTGYQHFVRKDGEYMLRVDPPSEGSYFSFFVKLNGSWEPRVRGCT